MWAIFIAIFGGLFWAVKLGTDRMSTKEADQRLEQVRITQDRWYAQVENFRLEKQITTTPGTPEHKAESAAGCSSG